ncbi:family 1 encapsulin nanocompartment shell protein [Nocardioides humi]|uniref:Type 1 encapsulin shell protein n=1 Tax=Nocardioides humi TaxID=449461 RepID=A0ABN2BE21_9ACTN|nr:family 1 encapsulin nanocompartment shell protein [Nocardioides humi]
MNHLLRALAPITDAGWQMLDDEAKERLTPALAARRLVDFDGPHGWDYSSRNLGRTTALDSPAAGVAGRRRRVLPAVELRAEFQLSLDELRAGDRGADDVDLGPLDDAAHRIATAENLAVLHGWGEAVTGVGAATPHDVVPLGGTPEAWPQAVATAVELLLRDGVAGPYGLALGNDEYRVVMESTEHGGYALREHLRRIVEGPIVWTPGLSGGVLVSQRGDDYLLDVGQDLALGYERHDAETVTLYLEESFTFHVATPEAAVRLSS